jgi:hypothetical protein
MQRIVLVMALAFCGVVAQADGVVINARRVTITAQQQAEENARTGRLAHCRVLNGMREGVGYGQTPEAAERACCFYNDAMRGRYRIVERGVARGPRGWFAVIRYE